MGNLQVKLKQIAVAVICTIAAHTSFATETITANGGAGGSAFAGAGATAGASAGAMSGAGAQANGSQQMQGGNARTIAAGMAAAVSPNACDSAVLWGLWPLESSTCAYKMIAQELLMLGQPVAALFVWCQDSRANQALRMANFQCPGRTVAMPVFQTGAEGDAGYGPYQPFQRVQQ